MIPEHGKSFVRNLIILLDTRSAMLSNSGSMEPLPKGDERLSGTQPAVAGSLVLSRRGAFRGIPLPRNLRWWTPRAGPPGGDTWRDPEQRGGRSEEGLGRVERGRMDPKGIGGEWKPKRRRDLTPSARRPLGSNVRAPGLPIVITCHINVRTRGHGTHCATHGSPFTHSEAGAIWLSC
jgi:hypothetical protein